MCDRAGESELLGGFAVELGRNLDGFAFGGERATDFAGLAVDNRVATLGTSVDFVFAVAVDDLVGHLIHPLALQGRFRCQQPLRLSDGVILSTADRPVKHNSG
jgi:hypothetical protein